MKETTLDALPNVRGISATGEETSLFELIKPGRYALVWWHPQALSPAACKSCGATAEPIQRLQEIYDGGCDVIGLTYESPERIGRYTYDIGLEYPILSVTEDDARAHGVAKSDHEPWRSIPHLRAFLVDEHGQVINRYEVGDARHFLQRVADDVRNGPPPSHWEPPRQTFLGKLLKWS